MISKVKKHIGFHYLLTETQLSALLFLELNIFDKKYQTISKINLSRTTSYVGFIFLFSQNMTVGKNLLDYTNLLSQDNVYINIHVYI